MMIKTGTRQEVVDYLHSICKPNPGHFKMEMNETYEMELHPIEDQIDDMIREGSPFVAVRLVKPTPSESSTFSHWTEHKPIVKKFLITDFAEVKTNMIIKEIDDLERRGKRIDAIKMLIQMEMDAEERWDRILSIVDGYYISQGKL